MFGLGTTEIIIILVVIVVLFGGARLAGLGRGLGDGIRNFRDAMRGEDKPEKPKDKDGSAS